MKTDDFAENLEQSQESIEPHHKAPERDLAAVNQMASDLMAELERLPEGDLVAEVVDNAIKLLRDQTNRGDIKLINKSMKEIRYALRVFAPYRETRKVSIFGSARTPEGDPDYLQAEEFAKGMVSSGWMVITGAGGGIMAAGHGGAGAGPSFCPAVSFSVRGQNKSFHPRANKVIKFKKFFTLPLKFVCSR